MELNLGNPSGVGTGWSILCHPILRSISFEVQSTAAEQTSVSKFEQAENTLRSNEVDLQVRQEGPNKTSGGPDVYPRRLLVIEALPIHSPGTNTDPIGTCRLDEIG